ncbi:MAG TPA: GxxExxY protein [Vicinamibacterales bacterium]|nr:GxxExxY protein [Vicinamibacterales bacterium]
MIRPYDAVEGLTERVIRCAIEVHRLLGPGLLESPYRECLLFELVSIGLKVERERLVPIVYKGQIVSDALKIDLLVENTVVVEVKAVDAIHPVHLAQVITYLRLTGHPAGLLLNFNAVTLKAGLRRLDHPDRYRKIKGTLGT